MPRPAMVLCYSLRSFPVGWMFWSGFSCLNCSGVDCFVRTTRGLRCAIILDWPARLLEEARPSMDRGADICPERCNVRSFWNDMIFNVPIGDMFDVPFLRRPGRSNRVGVVFPQTHRDLRREVE